MIEEDREGWEKNVRRSGSFVERVFANFVKNDLINIVFPQFVYSCKKRTLNKNLGQLIWILILSSDFYLGGRGEGGRRLVSHSLVFSCVIVGDRRPEGEAGHVSVELFNSDGKDWAVGGVT